jgi:hypothetical protein
MLAGEHSNPIGVYGFNPLEGWSRDVSADVAQELRWRCDCNCATCRAMLWISSSAMGAAAGSN